MIDSLRRLFFVSRPVSWPNTAYPFAAGWLVTGGQINIFFVIATIYFLGPYNLLMYGVNDVFDYESDIRNPRKGGIEGMREQRKFHPVILRTAITVNIPFIVWLFIFGNVLSNCALTILLFFVVAYSVAGLRFKEKPLLDSLTSSIHFIGPLIFALTLTHFSSQSYVYIIAFFLWGMASHAFGAVQDIIPDRKAELHSIATFFGARMTVFFCIILYVIASIFIIIQKFPVNVIGYVGLLYAANILPYVRTSDAVSHKTNKAWRRFIWLNLFAGFVVTLVLLFIKLKS
jgi:4-hydroxybenzoate polyprenyltransferase